MQKSSYTQRLIKEGQFTYYENIFKLVFFFVLIVITLYSYDIIKFQQFLQEKNFRRFDWRNIKWLQVGLILIHITKQLNKRFVTDYVERQLDSKYIEIIDNLEYNKQLNGFMTQYTTHVQLSCHSLYLKMKDGSLKNLEDLILKRLYMIFLISQNIQSYSCLIVTNVLWYKDRTKVLGIFIASFTCCQFTLLELLFYYSMILVIYSWPQEELMEILVKIRFQFILDFHQYKYLGCIQENMCYQLRFMIVLGTNKKFLLQLNWIDGITVWYAYLLENNYDQSRIGNLLIGENKLDHKKEN
ncbi:unnamed protein product [Paramecium primaurelia]|uniref:Transmembrane protein n=1 Tax=Paramecium primaurelia TaxID=5886 RepID=A0A8S1PIZ1_PARPR|nr:unnamed protein product [Paramecium primaurelia]